MQRTLFLCLTLASLALAQPIHKLLEGPPPTLSFEVHPADSQLIVYGDDGPHQMARTQDGRFILERPRSNLGYSETLQCEFQSEGYQSKKFLLQWSQVEAWSRSPGGRSPQPHQLRPQSWSAFLETYPWLYLGGLLPLGLVGLGLRWQSRRRAMLELTRLQKLVPDQLRKADPLLGLALGNYRLISRLGSGGMASVYKALPKETLQESEAVAIKVVRLDADDAHSRQLFEREIAVTVQLDHPNIVRTLEWGWEGSRPYLVLEWLEGGSLQDRLVPGGLPLEEALTILRAWFGAVAYAHQRGIVHRDIKPDNVLLTRSGLLKLMDFGLARAQATTSLSIQVGMTGTPGYQAPEQIQPGPETQYFAADQYSLGVSAYQLLCGRRPFEHEEVFGLIRLQLENEAPSILQFRPELGYEIAKVLQKMLSRSAESRYADVKTAGAALLEAISERARQSKEPG